MKKVFWGCLWFLNFLPLWIAIAVGAVFRCVRGEELSGAARWGLVGVAVGTVFSLSIVWISFRSFRREETIPVSVSTATEEKTASANVLLTYVLPLWAFDFADWIGWAQFALFFGVVVWLACRHLILEGCLFMELLGYRVFKCKLREMLGGEEKAWEYWVFSKESLEAVNGCERRMVELNNQARLLLPRAKQGE